MTTKDHMAMNVSVDDAVLKQTIATTSNNSSTTDPPAVVGSIDQGTSSTRFLLFSKQGLIVASAQIEHSQIFPNTGWHEHDPIEIWNNVVKCIHAVTKALTDKGFVLVSSNNSHTVPRRKKALVLVAIGITNQRETTIAWNRVTGLPYYNAIVWDDTRTADLVYSLAERGGGKDALREQTGLPLATYFAGTKVQWLLKNVPALQHSMAESPENVCFGTIDSWLVYQLTGSPSNQSGAANTNGMFVTDVTNASRWLLMDLTKQQWDPALVEFVCDAPIPIATALPKICPSSYLYGTCHQECGVDAALASVPIASIMGDQHAALFGQVAFQPGQAKNTYGTGLFLMMNTGTRAIPSTHGLLTTIAYQLGSDGPVTYALEGSVSHSGSTIQWLRDQLQMIDNAAQSEVLATPHNDGMYLVPAFAGLFAPRWRSDARACIVGMTASHDRGHVCRAALEATVYQTKEVFDAIEKDSHVQLETLKVDGGGTNNRLLMQFQADMLEVPVVKPVVMETTAIGVAFAAGLAVGLWKDLNELQQLWSVAETFVPKMKQQERESNWKGWQKAVTRSYGWVVEESSTTGNSVDEDEFVDALSEPEEEENGVLGKHRNSVILSVVAGLALSFGFLMGRRQRRY